MPYTLTLGVLAGAYKGRDIERRNLLTHMVYCDADGYPERSACRQNVDNLACFGDSPKDAEKRPTCATCSKKWDKLYGSKGISK